MEFFANTNHKLSDYKTVITATDLSESENSFGNILIKSTSKESHEWQFKVLNNYWSNGLFFGIVMVGHLDFNPVFTSNGYGYGLCSDGSIYSATSKGKHHKIIGSNFFFEKKKEINGNDSKFKQKKTTKAVKMIKKIMQNDIVCMTLNLKKRTLSFHINKQKKKLIVINKIKVSKRTNYKMAVYVTGEDDKVRLLQYINHNNINNCGVGDMEGKENEQENEEQNEEQKEEQKEEQNEQEEEEKNETSTENATEKIENESNVAIAAEISEKDKKIELLQKELSEIKIKSYQYLAENKELQTKLNAHKDEILKLEQDINGYKVRMQELDELKVTNGCLIEGQKELITKNEQLQIIIKQKEATEDNIKIEKLDVLNMQNESLVEEEKELEMENQRLLAEYKKLKIENMDVSKYESWGWFEIFVWIITIKNERFVKYEHDVHKILSEEQPTGHDLEYVNEADVKRWGVTNFGDIHVLRQSIQELINKYSMFVFLDK